MFTETKEQVTLSASLHVLYGAALSAPTKSFSTESGNVESRGLHNGLCVITVSDHTFTRISVETKREVLHELVGSERRLKPTISEPGICLVGPRGDRPPHLASSLP
jgi:hypothetical protein